MSCTAKALATLGPSIEAELRPHLSGLFAGFLRAYLPQTWVFTTEEDAASLVVDATGHATVTPAALPSPDVTVEGPHGQLLAALRLPGAPPAVAGALRVTPRTTKGKAAFDYLRPRFGL